MCEGVTPNPHSANKETKGQQGEGLAQVTRQVSAGEHPGLGSPTAQPPLDSGVLSWLPVTCMRPLPRAAWPPSSVAGHLAELPTQTPQEFHRWAIWTRLVENMLASRYQPKKTVIHPGMVTWPPLVISDTTSGILLEKSNVSG